MVSNEISAEEFVEYAIFLYGDQWRNVLPAELGISRRSLIISLASGEELPVTMTLSIVRLLEKRLEEMDRECVQLRDRIDLLRNSSSAGAIAETQVRGQLQYAC